MNTRGAPDCKPVKHGLKDFGGKFYASDDSNSGTIILGQDVLALYYTSREVLWARASSCVQGQEHRHRQGGPGVLRQASALHFGMLR